MLHLAETLGTFCFVVLPINVTSTFTSKGWAVFPDCETGSHVTRLQWSSLCRWGCSGMVLLLVLLPRLLSAALAAPATWTVYCFTVAKGLGSIRVLCCSYQRCSKHSCSLLDALLQRSGCLQHLVRRCSQEQNQFTVLPQSLCWRRGKSKQRRGRKRERRDAERNGKMTYLK